MAKTYSQMQKQIAKLQREADALKNKEVGGVVARIKEAIEHRVHYKGTLLDGKTFDSSYDRGEPATFPLDQVVPGWQEGIALMPVGSKYKFWIPAKLGYGDKGTPGGPIPPNATLVFEVELLDIVKQDAK